MPVPGYAQGDAAPRTLASPSKRGRTRACSTSGISCGIWCMLFLLRWGLPHDEGFSRRLRDFVCLFVCSLQSSWARASRSTRTSKRPRTHACHLLEETSALKGTSLLSEDVSLSWDCLLNKLCCSYNRSIANALTADRIIAKLRIMVQQNVYVTATQKKTRYESSVLIEKARALQDSQRRPCQRSSSSCSNPPTSPR